MIQEEEVLIVVKNDDIKTFYHIPKDFIPEEVRQLESIDLHGNVCYFNERLLCHKYFGIGLDEKFTLLHLVSNKNDINDYEEIINSIPIFKDFQIDIKKTILKNINDIITIKLDGRIKDLYRFS